MATVYGMTKSRTRLSCLCVCVGPLLTLECLLPLVLLPTVPGDLQAWDSCGTPHPFFSRRRNEEQGLSPPPTIQTAAPSEEQERAGSGLQDLPQAPHLQPITVTIAVTFLAIIFAAPDQPVIEVRKLSLRGWSVHYRILTASCLASTHCMLTSHTTLSPLVITKQILGDRY